jgi:DNA-binding CsgD family transcriptional regulator
MQTYLRLLTHSNLQRLFNEVEVLYKPVRPQQLAGHFAGVLRRLISGKFHAVVRPKGAGDQVRRDRTLYPAPANWENLAETFESLYQKSPLRSIRESGNLHEPMAISDITNRQTFESLDLYHEGYRILGVSDNLSVKILGHRVCVAVLRERRGFSDQDRAILSALRPHMERAYRYARELESWRATAKKGTEATDDTTGAAESLQGQAGSPRSLCVLGLSEREAEVLYWVAAGKTSPVISMILGIRHDTVRAHLKRVFAKLGVENRLSAALRALEVLRSVPPHRE